ncbi:hypothetical protein CRG98_032272 [Punica granatum]|uniref:Probable purine permease n=1 Tax=Punica granatum TaxID=22663 RepID=A0A2I0ITK7_PUNGR|nr:hypothetical protein CRG98_032272 [Punica granatum]
MAEDEVNPNNTALCRKILLVLNCIILSIGTTGGPLVMRLYFIHGGERVWLLSWLETAAWPIIMAPLAISYTYRRRRWAAATAKGGSTWPPPRRVLMKPFLFVASAVVGVLTGVDNYLYAYGNARLPVSTSSLIIASQLAFTAGFAFLLVKQRFTSYSINSVFLLTLAAVVLALHAGSDRPEGESDRDYMLGFVMTVVAAALYGFLLPLVELSYKKVNVYALINLSRLLILQVIPREAKEFGLGEFKYYTVLVCSAIVWQCFFLGTIGVIFCASSLSSGVVVAVMLPVTEILAVIFFKEKFSAEKGVSLVLSLWGLISYFYKEIKHIKKMNLNQSRNQDQNQPPPQEVEMNGQSLP